jgi:hypothetical protein
MAACTANTGDASKCQQFECMGDPTQALICNATTNCWQYTGTNAGHVSTTLGCPAPTDPMWT